MEPESNFWYVIRYSFLTILLGALFIVGSLASMALFHPTQLLSHSPYLPIFFVSYDTLDVVISLVRFGILYFRWILHALIQLFTGKQRPKFGWRWTVITLVALAVWCGWNDVSSRREHGPLVSRFMLLPTANDSPIKLDGLFWEGHEAACYPLYNPGEIPDMESTGDIVLNTELLPIPKENKLKLGATYDLRMSSGIRVTIHVSHIDPDYGTMIIDGFSGGESTPTYHYGKMMNVKLYDR